MILKDNLNLSGQIFNIHPRSASRGLQSYSVQGVNWQSFGNTFLV